MRGSRIGILAGGGSLPREIADVIVGEGGSVFIVRIDGEAEADFAGHPSCGVRWGQIGRMLAAFRDEGCRSLVVVGSVRRPRLLDLRPDLGFLRTLPLVLQVLGNGGGDDAVLRRVARFLEAEGFRVLGPRDVAPGLLLGEGAIGRLAPAAADAADIALGFEIVGRLGPFDIGQGAVVRDGRLLAVEGVEGTDAMLARIRPAPDGARQRRGVLVKAPKPGQELRLDLPAIGPETLKRAAAAGLAGIAVRAGYVLAAERQRLAREADLAGLFVAGVAVSGGPDPGGGGLRAQPDAPADTTRVLGRWPCGAAGAEDARKACAVVSALAPYRSGRVVVAARRRVLAVEAGGEGVLSVLARSGGRRPQGPSWLRPRAGVAAFAAARDIDAQAVEAVAATGLAGVAVLAPGEGVSSHALAEADRARLFVAAIGADEGERHGA